jgi:hypothetical protein
MQQRDNVAVAVGAAILGLGVVVLVALIGWAAYTPGSNLASEIWFWPVLIALVVIIIVGLYALSSPYHGGWMPEPCRRYQMTVEGDSNKQPHIEKIEGKNISTNQSGGHTGDVYVGRGRRQLTRPELGQLQRELIEGGPRTVSLTATLGDAESHEFAVQVSDMIERIGWKTEPDGVSQGLFSGPIRGVDITVPATN